MPVKMQGGWILYYWKFTILGDIMGLYLLINDTNELENSIQLGVDREGYRNLYGPQRPLEDRI